MATQMTSRLFGICLIVASVNSYGTVFYEDDFESGVKYLGQDAKHPGGGYIAYLGGEVNKINSPGDGTQDGRYYTNVILDKSANAAGSLKGSTASLKTQYRGVGSGKGWGFAGDYGLNTTIISFPETPTVFIRWYQKWGKDWIWPADQQKLAKVLGPEQSQNFKVSFKHNFIHITKKSPPPNDSMNETYVYSDLKPMGESVSDWRQNDSLASTSNFPLEKDHWYCVEIMVKSNTPGLSDGELAYWIDGSQKFDLKNTSNRGASTKGIDNVQMQHVLQDVWDGARPDTPTWMDNVVIANERISCPEDPNHPTSASYKLPTK